LKYDPQKHHRRSIRLKGYDYTQAGWYFITLCIKNREMLFGAVVNGEMVLNEWGKIAEIEWQKTEEIRKNIVIDLYVIMPNHLHGIIGIVEDKDRSVRANSYSPQRDQFQPHGFRSPSKTIGAIIRGYKVAVTKKINISRNTPGLPIWQRNYYERVIRDEPELNRIRKYIIENPSKWEYDKYY
jgi:putative transposase